MSAEPAARQSAQFARLWRRERQALDVLRAPRTGWKTRATKRRSARASNVEYSLNEYRLLQPRELPARTSWRHHLDPLGGKVAKPKRKLTKAEKRARRERKEKYMIIFINGKQKRVPRPRLIEGLPVDEFIARNADPMWLHQNELWELMTPDDENEAASGFASGPDLPF